MVKVTERAKEELKRLKSKLNLEAGKCLRLATPPMWTGEGDFGIVTDTERSGDQPVEYEGQTVLMVDGQLAEMLATAVVDWKDSSQGPRFTIDVY